MTRKGSSKKRIAIGWIILSGMLLAGCQGSSDQKQNGQSGSSEAQTEKEPQVAAHDPEYGSNQTAFPEEWDTILENGDVRIAYFDVTGDGSEEVIILKTDGGTDVSSQELFIVDVARMKQIIVDPAWHTELRDHVQSTRVILPAQPDTDQNDIPYELTMSDGMVIEGEVTVYGNDYSDAAIVVMDDIYRKITWEEDHVIRVAVGYALNHGVLDYAGEIQGILKYDPDSDRMILAEEYSVIQYQ